MGFMKKNRERLCIHVSVFYVCQDLSQPSFMEINLFMDITNMNFNIFESVGD